MTDETIVILEIVGTLFVLAVIVLLAWRMVRRQPPYG